MFVLEPNDKNVKMRHSENQRNSHITTRLRTVGVLQTNDFLQMFLNVKSCVVLAVRRPGI